jgi:hypothetical protein
LSLGDDFLFEKEVESLYNDFDSGITLMGRTMDRAAATPPEGVVQTESEARESLFGAVSRIDMQSEVCKEAVGKFSLGKEYFAPLYSTVPTLFFKWNPGRGYTSSKSGADALGLSVFYAHYR